MSANRRTSYHKSSFQRGSGCFSCKRCGKKTRETGGGNAACDLCPVCDELTMCVNSLSDGGHPNAGDAIFAGAKTVADVRRIFTDECKKAGIFF